MENQSVSPDLTPNIDPAEDPNDTPDENADVTASSDDTPTISAKVTFHKIQFEDETCHTLLEMPCELQGEVDDILHKADETFNILMADVSGSMHSWWNHVLTNWNELIAPKLIGTTKIYTFGDVVKFRREDTVLHDEDFDSSCTNLTEGIETIRREVEKCSQSIIRVFLITDGFHNSSNIEPDEAIEKLNVPDGKFIEVFLIGVGLSFPVEYSISLRSHLHNGNSNLPSIFWAKEEDDYENEMKSIADILIRGFVKFELSVPGFSVPGLETSSVGHQGEYFYYACSPEDLGELSLSMEGHGSVSMETVIEVPDLRFFLDKVFRQWNSIIIQQHRNKKEIPHEAFDVMEKIYKYLIKEEETKFKAINPDNNIKTRLQRKHLKSMEVDYSTLMNQSKMIIGLEGKYKTELELAENILKTTVKSKYDAKNLKMKGHSSDDYAKDIKEFMEVRSKHKENILGLKDPSSDDCCSITFASTVTDLKDSSIELLAEEDKFTFMRTFTVTGIPIYAPIKDSSQINPWTIRIKKILVSPYKVVSQTALEMSADAGIEAGVEDKDVYLQEGDESSRFNAIVPVYSEDVIAVLKPLFITNIFQMVSTFCILKNPHIIDHNAHIAALASIWAKTIDDNPIKNRAEFAESRLKLIEATASMYLDRRGIASYIDILLSKTNQALMTESTETFGKSTLKCEALTKPAFFLYLIRNQEAKLLRKEIFTLIAAEYIGRCMSGKQQEVQKSSIKSKKISRYQMNQNIVQTKMQDSKSSDEVRLPYSQYFASSSEIAKDEKNSVDSKLDELMNNFTTDGTDLLKNYFTLELLIKSMKQYCRDQVSTQMDSLFEIKLNMGKIKHLRNPSATGDLSWPLLRKLGDEIGLQPEELDKIFGIQSTFIYVCHALKHNASRDRLEATMPDYDEAFKIVKKKVDYENLVTFKRKFEEKILKEAEKRWREAHATAHFIMAIPMTTKQFINAAVKRGIDVNEETFPSIYKYNAVSGLARNTCMVETCPHYLMPDNRFNQHISIEREVEGFPHKLHQTSLLISKNEGGAAEVMDMLLNFKQVKSKQKKQKIYHPASLEILKPLEQHIESLVSLYRTLAPEVVVLNILPEEVLQWADQNIEYM